MVNIKWHSFDTVPRDGKPVTLWHTSGMRARSVRHLTDAEIADMKADTRNPWVEEAPCGERKFWPDRVFSRWTRDFDFKMLE